MALTSINARVTKGDDRPAWEKILDAATKAAQLTGAGFDIVNSIKTSKINARKQDVDEADKFEPAKPGEEGAVTLPTSVFGKNISVKPRASEDLGTVLKTLQTKELSRKLGPPTESTKQQWIQNYPNDPLPDTQDEASSRLSRTYVTPQQDKEFQLRADVINDNRENKKLERERKRELDRRSRTVTLPPEISGGKKTLISYAPDKESARKLRESIEVTIDANQTIDDLIKLRSEKGAEVLDRDSVALAKQNSRSLQLKLKELETLGVLSKTDIEEFLNPLVPKDPLAAGPKQMTFGLYDSDPIMETMKNLKKIFNQKVQAKIRSLNMPLEYTDGDFVDAATDEEANAW